MTSFQNTSEFYSAFSEYISYSENCMNQTNFYDQNPSNHECHQTTYASENYIQQEVCLIPDESSIYDPIQREMLHTNNDLYENSSDPQYNVNQYTPLTSEPINDSDLHLQPTHHKNKHYMAKKHYAQITILPSSKRNFKAVVKRKRKRTVFTTEQVEALENIFKTKQYISREERQEIVKRLKLDDKAVKIWFQNRRLKTKRMPEQLSEETEYCSSVGHSVKERSSPDIARLNFVESQINNKTDEFGFVTLDEGVMEDLVNVIDDFLTKSVGVTADENSRSNTSPIYEPISPASIADSNEENSSYWKPSEPNEALQRLFDLQGILSL